MATNMAAKSIYTTYSLSLTKLLQFSFSLGIICVNVIMLCLWFLKKQLPKNYIKWLLSRRTKICYKIANYVKLVSFNFGNFCSRYNVITQLRICQYQSINSYKPLISDEDQPSDGVLRYAPHLYFMIFCIYPRNYLGYFVQGQFHQPTTQVFCEGMASNLRYYYVLKFSNSRTCIFGMSISWKIQDFPFWPGFNASKKIKGILQQLNILFLDTFPGVFSEYIQS